MYKIYTSNGELIGDNLSARDALKFKQSYSGLRIEEIPETKEEIDESISLEAERRVYESAITLAVCSLGALLLIIIALII